MDMVLYNKSAGNQIDCEIYRGSADKILIIEIIFNR